MSDTAEPQPGETWARVGHPREIYTIRAVADGYVWHAPYMKPGDTDNPPGFYAPTPSFTLNHSRVAAPLEYGLTIHRATNNISLTPLANWPPDQDAPDTTIIIYHDNHVEVIR